MPIRNQLLWKRRQNIAVAPDYRRLLQPLPEPPEGLSWVRYRRNSSSNKSGTSSTLTTNSNAEQSSSAPEHQPYGWMLVDTTGDIVAVPAADSDTVFHEEASFTSTTTGEGTATALCVPFDDWEGYSVLESSALTPVSNAPAMASVVHAPVDGTALVTADLRNHGGSDDDSVALPQATLVVTDRMVPSADLPDAEDRNIELFYIAVVMAQFKHLSMMEATCYLKTNDWDLEEALEEAWNDEVWEREEKARQKQQSQPPIRRNHSPDVGGGGVVDPNHDFDHSTMRQEDDSNRISELLDALNSFFFFAPGSPRSPVHR